MTHYHTTSLTNGRHSRSSLRCRSGTPRLHPLLSPSSVPYELSEITLGGEQLQAKLSTFLMMKRLWLGQLCWLVQTCSIVHVGSSLQRWEIRDGGRSTLREMMFDRIPCRTIQATIFNDFPQMKEIRGEPIALCPRIGCTPYRLFFPCYLHACTHQSVCI